MLRTRFRIRTIMSAIAALAVAMGFFNLAPTDDKIALVRAVTSVGMLLAVGFGVIGIVEFFAFVVRSWFGRTERR